MQRVRLFFRNADAGPVILRLEKQAAWGRLDAVQFRKVFVLVSVLAVALLMLTWSRVRVLANAYQIMELKSERDTLLAEHRRLQRKLEGMQSLNYAEQVARQRLGMVDINPNQVIALRKKSAAESLMDDVAALFTRDKPKPEPKKR